MIDLEKSFMFIHGHAKRLTELLSPDNKQNEYGGLLGGYTEAEVMGHLNMLALYANQLGEYYKELTLDTSEKRIEE